MWIRDKAQLLKQDISFAFFKLKGGKYTIGAPSLDDDTLQSLRSDMLRSSGYLEYGSGGSTPMAANLVKGPVTTVESDVDFLEAVKKAVPDGNRSRVNFLHANIGKTTAWGRPRFPWNKRSWVVYPQIPWDMMTYVPDLIFIDGRFRLACALTSILRVPQGWDGVIYIDDYDNRPHYHAIEKFAFSHERVGRSLRFRVGTFDRDQCKADLINAQRNWQ